MPELGLVERLLVNSHFIVQALEEDATEDGNQDRATRRKTHGEMKSNRLIDNFIVF